MYLSTLYRCEYRMHGIHYLAQLFISKYACFFFDSKPGMSTSCNILLLRMLGVQDNKNKTKPQTNAVCWFFFLSHIANLGTFWLYYNTSHDQHTLETVNCKFISKCRLLMNIKLSSGTKLKIDILLFSHCMLTEETCF